MKRRYFMIVLMAVAMLSISGCVGLSIGSDHSDSNQNAPCSIERMS